VNISEPFILRPIATSLLMAAVAFVGLAAFPFLPVAPLPQVDFPTIQVTTALAGASAENMASSVAAPLERQIGQIPGVTQMTSMSTLGATTIVVQFDLNRNIDAAALDVQSAITAAGRTLPLAQLTTPPVFRKTNPADTPIMIYGVYSDTLPLTTMDDLIDNYLSPQIAQISGVSQVFIGGETKPAIRVQVDPARLAAIGLSLEDVRNGLVASSTTAAKGTLRTSHTSFTIAANDQLSLPEQYNDVILAYRNGGAVRVRDIGEAILGATDDTVAAYYNRIHGLVLYVTKQPGVNIIDTVENIKAVMPHLTENLPAGMNIELILDRTTTIRASVHDVELTLMLTVALVVLVILLFLRNFWATLIPASTVPLALLGSFAAMYLLKFSLDNISLMALTIAVGFVVDDAIVVVENIYRHIEHGMSPFEAAITGSREIGFTVLSISFSLIAVFIPLLLMGGIIGRLFREFSMTVTAAIAVSALVSLTLAPMMCSRFMHPESGEHGRVFRVVERGFEALMLGYRQSLDIVLRHQAITLAVFFATMALTIVMGIQIPKGFFPIQDTGIIQAFSEADQGIASEKMMQVVQAQNAVLLRDPDIFAIAAQTGSTGAFANTSNTGRSFIVLKPRDERALSATQIMDRLRPQLAKVEGAALFMQPVQDITVGGRWPRHLSVHLAGCEHFRTDRMVAEDARQVAHAAANCRCINRPLGQRAAAQGHHQSRPGRTLRYFAAGDRRYAQRRLWPASDRSVFHPAQYLLGHRGDHAGTAEVARFAQSHLPQVAADRWLGPIIGACRLRFEYGRAARGVASGQFPAVTLTFNLQPGVALGEAIDAITEASREIGLPSSVIPTFQGNAQAFQQSLSTTPVLIAAALVVVYLILGMLYESFIHPLTILSTLPSAGVGALLALNFGHMDLSVIGIIGIILLIGIVKKNGIMLVDFAITAERDRHLPPVEAIREACLLRFRPILMTTMAAMLAGLPLALGHGTGSELRQPLGYAMVAE
jgi:multidrug efflux pump subunit AcrB